MNTPATIVCGVVVSLAAAAGVAWLWSWPARVIDGGLDYAGLAHDLAPAPISHFTARDGSELAYRAYPADAARTLAIVLHGSGADSRYLAPMARDLAEQGVAQVVTPDIRGHGRAPIRRGDVDDVEQPQRDLVDLIEHLRGQWPIDRVVLIGHSSGGGLAVRMAGGRFADLIDGYVLLAPYLGHAAPTSRAGSGGWAQANVGRIVLIEILSRFGVDSAAGCKVVRFNIPESHRDEYSTPAYSYRMQQAMAPRDWRRDLAAIEVPALLLVGAEDESMRPDAYGKVVADPFGVAVEILDGVGHLGIVRAEPAIERLARFIRGLAITTEAGSDTP
ncbi:alpha/beta hydrolase [Salinicola sp. JS01]|uniref:alpha/beta hydrolase n=1 Tax=Salinicola sp. JS01 TaxID=3050071 RepID=UPI00255B533F|nr:alpha/beta hydrolase [Salinicola sp. JS01]WIX33424.1 alpha/beta hydrolase [Salinicola sp. JS01]